MRRQVDWPSTLRASRSGQRLDSLAAVVRSGLEYVIANVGVVVWQDWRKAALVAAGAALLTIAVILAEPDVWLDVLVVLAMCSALLWTRRTAPRERCALANL